MKKEIVEKKLADALETERKEQKEFYEDLIEGIKEKRINPSQALRFEDVDIPSAEEIIKMPRNKFRLFYEKWELAQKLQATRKNMELREIEDIVADKILNERSRGVEEKLKKMTPSERSEFDDRVWEEAFTGDSKNSKETKEPKEPKEDDYNVEYQI